MILNPVALTPELFAPFGQVLMAEASVPELKPWAARVDSRRPEAQANITYMSFEPAHYPVLVPLLERHPFSHQIFVPLEGAAHLVLVCPSLPDGSPDYVRALAFQAGGGQAVNYNANVWHAPRTILHRPGAFIMMRWDSGTAADTELFELPEPITVTPAQETGRG